MKNPDIAERLEEIAHLLDLREESAFRVLAYRNAARELRATGYDIAGLLAAGEPLPKMPGIGPELFRLPGAGPKRVRVFYEKLRVGSLEELEAAIRDGRLRALGGFGAMSEQKILEAIQKVKSGHGEPG